VSENIAKSFQWSPFLTDTVHIIIYCWNTDIISWQFIERLEPLYFSEKSDPVLVEVLYWVVATVVVVRDSRLFSCRTDWWKGLRSMWWWWWWWWWWCTLNTVEYCVLIGSANSAVDWSGIPSSIRRVPSCKRHRRPKPDEGCRLSGGVEPATDLWRGTGTFLQQRETERGKLNATFSTCNVDYIILYYIVDLMSDYIRYLLIVVCGVKQVCNWAGASSDTKLFKLMFLQYNAQLTCRLESLIAVGWCIAGDNYKVERWASWHRVGGVRLGKHVTDCSACEPHAFWSGGTHWSAQHRRPDYVDWRRQFSRTATFRLPESCQGFTFYDCQYLIYVHVKCNVLTVYVS